jgi:hypothetical protein
MLVSVQKSRSPSWAMSDPRGGGGGPTTTLAAKDHGTVQLQEQSQANKQAQGMRPIEEVSWGLIMHIRLQLVITSGRLSALKPLRPGAL